MPNSVALPYVVEIGWLHIHIVDHQFMDKSLISMLSSVTRLSKCYMKKFLFQIVVAAIAVLYFSMQSAPILVFVRTLYGTSQDSVRYVTK